MHIPDGYLGPITCGATYAVMVPVWAFASHKVKKSLHAKQVPLLAVGAAFCFVVMMFNIPIPGGTTGHAVGGALAAILLGPWAACIAVSVALVIQALLFGDGGVTTLGANCFNMAFVMPFTGYAVYRLISGKSAAASLRRVVAAGIAGYAGLVSAAVVTGIEFGVQPLLHHTASGQPLYCPYGLAVALPVMAGEHLLVFGWIELAVTALAIKFLQAQEPALLAESEVAPKIAVRKTWTILALLALLSPLGLWLPAHFGAGGAWGEWSAETLKTAAGYVPAGIEKFSSLWNAPLPGYAPKGLGEGTGMARLGAVYVFSAFLGILLCLGAVFCISKFLPAFRRGKPGGSIEKTVLDVVSLVKYAVAGDAVARRSGMLQSCEPKLKLVSAALLLLAILFSKSIIVTATLYLIVVAVALRSSITPLFFFQRTLLFVPIFAGIIAAPAIFSVVTPGRALLSFSLAGVELCITVEGVAAAGLFFMRVLASASLGVLLVLTTRRHLLLKALRVFKVPRIFVMVMEISYRYIFLFLDTIQNTFIAVKSRVGFVASPKTGRRLAAQSVAGLWLRSYSLHAKVYDAMLSRGYTGEPKAFDELHVRGKDAAVLITSLFILTGTLWLNRFFH
jgi:cobalt/nickel transport system permease protein